MINITQASRALGVSRPTVYTMIADGKLEEPITAMQLETVMRDMIFSKNEELERLQDLASEIRRM